MANRIIMKAGKNYAEFEESDSWEETKDRCLGALQRILLSRDRNKKVEGVYEI